jgi:predicted acetyltransferase
VLGHIGYSTVPWRQGNGFAKEALRLILLKAKEEGLPYVELTAAPNNYASQRVIEANGGRVIERFTKSEAYGGGVSIRYRIDLE